LPQERPVDRWVKVTSALTLAEAERRDSEFTVAVVEWPWPRSTRMIFAPGRLLRRVGRFWTSTESGHGLRLYSLIARGLKAEINRRRQPLDNSCPSIQSRPEKAGLLSGREVPPRGFEPLISALKGRRPRPLDDGGRY
jgi:hypothetical protein